MPHADHILNELKQARAAAKAGKNWPKTVKLFIYNASGKSVRISKRLAGMGIKFVNYNEFSPIRRPAFRNAASEQVVEGLQRSARALEEQAAPRLVGKEARALELRVAKGITSRAGTFVKKRLPKLISQALLKASATKAAKRAASLVPLAGWAFAAHDAYRGVEDIYRGHVARGLAGVGLAIVDVGSDFLHLGDAVSGVGGTALSLGVQAGTIAGQIKIELDRMEEKLQELGEEISRLGALPPDSKLHDYYDLDDDAISDLKKEFAMKDEEPEPPVEFPEPPPIPALQPPCFHPLPPPLPEPPPSPSSNPGKPWIDPAEHFHNDGPNDSQPRWVDQPIA
jgi:hypothetical protein